MKIFIYVSISLILISCYNQRKHVNKMCDSYFLVNPQETSYECDNQKIVKDPFYGFVLYNSDIKSPQEGVFSVSITFDSIHNENDSIRILSVEPKWIRIKESISDSIIVNQSLFNEINDKTLLRYQTELLSAMMKCNCHITYFNKDFIPLKIGYHFRFTVLNDSIF